MQIFKATAEYIFITDTVFFLGRAGHILLGETTMAKSANLAIRPTVDLLISTQIDLKEIINELLKEIKASRFLNSILSNYIFYKTNLSERTDPLYLARLLRVWFSF